MLPRAGVAADRIDEVIAPEPPSTTPLPPQRPARGRGPTAGRGGVRRRQLPLSRLPTSDALEHISFTAKPGETTAIIGSTGCGKSTCSTSSRALRCDRRQVTHGRRGRARHAQAQLHDLLGYVPQKGVLFSGTIDTNLKFGGDPSPTPTQSRPPPSPRPRSSSTLSPRASKPHCPGRLQRLRRPEAAPFHRPRHCQAPAGLSV